MPSLASGISNLFSSLFEILSGIVNGVISALQSVFGLARDVITSIFDMVAGLVTSIFDLMSGLVGFVLGNIVIIGVLVAVYVGYSAYRQKNQGGGVTGGVKRS
ncbi:MAG: hypothetical protein Q9175_006112 [Cornicularia normoerica]